MSDGDPYAMEKIKHGRKIKKGRGGGSGQGGF